MSHYTEDFGKVSKDFQSLMLFLVSIENLALDAKNNKIDVVSVDSLLKRAANARKRLTGEVQ